MEEKTALATPSADERRAAPSNLPDRSSASAAGGESRPEPWSRDQGPQLTVRAILTGVLLGALLSVCNIYVGLRVGIVVNMSIIGALLGYAIWTGLHGLDRSRVRPWGILENNLSQTACSSAAAVASAGLIGPIPALTLVTGVVLPWSYLALWVLSVCLVGIAVATTLRRQMLLRDQLPFPLGTATAEMLRELHSRGRQAAARIWALLSGGAAACALALAVKWCRIGRIGLPVSIGGFKAGSLTFGLEPSLWPVAIGGLIGFRGCVSLLLGAVLAYGVLAPPLIRQGKIAITATVSLARLPSGVELDPGRSRLRYDERRKVLEFSGTMSDAERAKFLALSDERQYRDAVDVLYWRSQQGEHAGQAPDGLAPVQPTHRDLLAWLVWPGTTLMVVASLLALAFSWRSTLAAFRRPLLRPAEAETVAAGEVPPRWVVGGVVLALALSVVLQIVLFDVVWWIAPLGVALAFVLVVVATRVSGETGITPVGQVAKVAQLTLGAVHPPVPAANLIGANVAGGAASQSADLLDDLKCGWLLGAWPRRQVVAQLCGALTGAMVGSAVYLLLLPRPTEQLLTKEWPAPGAATLKAVAELFQVGFDALPEGTPTAIVLAAAAAAVLTVLERLLPARVRRFVPSPVGIGLAFVIPAHTALSMFCGGLVLLILGRLTPGWTRRFAVPICAGIIAGESLTGVGLLLHEYLAGGQ